MNRIILMALLSGLSVGCGDGLQRADDNSQPVVGDEQAKREEQAKPAPLATPANTSPNVVAAKPGAGLHTKLPEQAEPVKPQPEAAEPSPEAAAEVEVVYGPIVNNRLANCKGMNVSPGTLVGLVKVGETVYGMTCKGSTGVAEYLSFDKEHSLKYGDAKYTYDLEGGATSYNSISQIWQIWTNVEERGSVTSRVWELMPSDGLSGEALAKQAKWGSE
jgi:hypothetical protein